MIGNMALVVIRGNSGISARSGTPPRGELAMIMRRVLSIALLLVSASIADAADPSKCPLNKMKAAAKGAKKLLSCSKSAVVRGVAVDPNCVAAAEAALLAQLAAADDGAPCLGDPNEILGRVRALATNTTAFALLESSGYPRCQAVKIGTTAKHASGTLKLIAKNRFSPDGFVAKIATLRTKFDAALTKLATAGFGEGQCGVPDITAARLKGLAERFAFQVMAAATFDASASLIDLSFSDVSVAPAPDVPMVILDGTLTVGPDGSLAGQVEARFGASSVVIIDADAGDSLVLHAGSHTLDLLAADPHQFLLDGAPITMTEAVDAFDQDKLSGTPADEWTASSQALLSLMALTTTPAWQMNYFTMYARSAEATAVGAGGLAWCKNVVATARAAGGASCAALAALRCAPLIANTPVYAACWAFVTLACELARDELLSDEKIASLLWNGSCGDGHRDPDEECDGADAQCPQNVECTEDCQCFFLNITNVVTAPYRVRNEPPTATNVYWEGHPAFPLSVEAFPTAGVCVNPPSCSHRFNCCGIPGCDDCPTVRMFGAVGQPLIVNILGCSENSITEPTFMYDVRLIDAKGRESSNTWPHNFLCTFPP